MKNYILLWLFLTGFGIIAQEEPVERINVIAEARAYYDQIDKSEMKTDYLFNRGFVILNQLDEWYRGKPISTRFSHWKLFLESIQESNIQAETPIIDFSELISANKISYTDEPIIGLSLFHYDGNYISQEGVERGMNNESFQIEPLTLSSGTVMYHDIYSKDVIFSWNPDHYFANTNSTSVYVNFEDGNGYQKLSLENEQNFSVLYRSIGEKSIRFKVVEEDGKETVSYSYIDVKAFKVNQPTARFVIDRESNIIDFNELKSSLQKKNATDPKVDLSDYRAEYAYYEGCDGILNKPIIIGEGFDFNGSTDPETLYTEWNVEGRVDKLCAKGYDVFFVSYIHHNRSLHLNALAVEALIKGINNRKYGHQEIIVIGESTSGLLERIAIRNLEMQGIDHEVGLYISYDAPQAGANIPKATQWLFHDFLFYTDIGNKLLLLSFVTEGIESIFGIDIKALDLYGQLTSDAAQQMIATHFKGNGKHSLMQNHFKAIGYPKLSRNIAFVNGSDNGERSRSSENGGHIYSGDPIRLHKLSLNLGVAKIHTGGFYERLIQNHNVAGFRIEIGGHEVLNFGHTEYNGPQEWSSGPGSYFTLGNLQAPFMFNPTVGAIDLKRSVFDQGNFYHVKKNKSQIIELGRTPFDDFYANSQNFEHTEYEQDMYLALETQEFMYDDLYLQAKEIKVGRRDFIRTNTITAGDDVQPDFFTNRSESQSSLNKHVDIEGVQISGGNTHVSFTAGKSIHLKKGFKAKANSRFRAKIRPVNYGTCAPHQRSENESEQNAFTSNVSNNYQQPPKILGNRYVCSTASYTANASVVWHLVGENVDVVESGKSYTTPAKLPLGQYTLYATQNGFISSLLIEKTTGLRCEDEALLNKESLETSSKLITLIYPNPAQTTLHIESQQNITSYVILDATGKQIEQKELNSRKANVDVSMLKPGFYFLTLKTDMQTEQFKFIKQ